MVDYESNIGSSIPDLCLYRNEYNFYFLLVFFFAKELLIFSKGEQLENSSSCNKSQTWRAAESDGINPSMSTCWQHKPRDLLCTVHAHTRMYSHMHTHRFPQPRVSPTSSPSITPGCCLSASPLTQNEEVKGSIWTSYAPTKPPGDNHICPPKCILCPVIPGSGYRRT